MLIQNWNAVVRPGDLVYHTGDFALCDEDRAVKIAKRLVGQKFLTFGNHDKRLRKNKDFLSQWAWAKDLADITVDNQKIVLCHYAFLTWAGSHKGSWDLHGHCVDDKTEILTTDGWKRYDEVTVGDGVYSYNPVSQFVESDIVKELILNAHNTETMYRFEGKSIDYMVTSGHTMVGLDYLGRFIERPASVFCTGARQWVINAAERNILGADWTDDEIRLYVWLAADGNIVNTDLGRLRVLKGRKIKAIRDLLGTMKIRFTENSQKDDSVCMNFTIPTKILAKRIKGLDDFIMGFNTKQFEVLLEAYEASDGHRTGDTVIIYSAKEREIDLIQALAVLSGYRATKHTRTRGDSFSDKPQHQLSVSKNPTVTTNSKSAMAEPVHDFAGITWCIKNRNQNFFCRRNGKVHLTGNSHGSLKDDPHALRTDVGVDCWDYYPVSFEEIRKLMSKKVFKPVDHHGQK